MRVGIVDHPEYYVNTGLTVESTFEEFQQFLHDRRPQTGCPATCTEDEVVEEEEEEEMPPSQDDGEASSSTTS
eukprot:Awhi_evm1s11681